MLLRFIQAENKANVSESASWLNWLPAALCPLPFFIRAVLSMEYKLNLTPKFLAGLEIHSIINGLRRFRANWGASLPTNCTVVRQLETVVGLGSYG